MPRMSTIALPAPARPVQPPPFALSQTLNSIRLDSIRNEPAPTFTYCHLATATGKHERQAIGHSLSVCYDIFAGARENTSSREKNALNQAMIWMGPDSTDRLGQVALTNMTAVGAAHAGISQLLRGAPEDPVLHKCRREIEGAIIRVGVRVGRCRTAPSGVLDSTKGGKLCKAQAEAVSCLTRSLVRIGGQRLIDGIAQAILARPMFDSIVERRPRLAAMLGVPGPIDLHGIVNERVRAHYQQVIGAMLENGTPESMKEAVFTLVMIPDAVKLGMPLDPPEAGSPAES